MLQSSHYQPIYNFFHYHSYTILFSKTVFILSAGLFNQLFIFLLAANFKAFLIPYTGHTHPSSFMSKHAWLKSLMLHQWKFRIIWAKEVSQTYFTVVTVLMACAGHFMFAIWFLTMTRILWNLFSTKSLRTNMECDSSVLTLISPFLDFIHHSFSLGPH